MKGALFRKGILKERFSRKATFKSEYKSKQYDNEKRIY